MKQKIILRVISKFLIPYILLFALYVQWHGDFGPGGTPVSELPVSCWAVIFWTTTSWRTRGQGANT
ncbi:MAG: MnhB domain-containing protein [Rhodospirillales bacterium]|nr:MnhB domain-containing protein [Rhodospirillales bacterium]